MRQQGSSCPTFKISTSRSTTQSFTARYWDTPDVHLLAWGHMVRHRSASDGREHEWAVKIDTASEAATARRNEIDIPGDTFVPPEAARSLVRPFTAH